MKHFGFIEPTITYDHFVLGGFNSLPKIIYQTDGNWFRYLPKYEAQYNSQFDTYGCTVFGTQNALEIFIKRLTETEPNYSERFTYIVSEVTPPGADPHKIANDIRHYGLIDNSSLPFTDSFVEFLEPSPMTPNLLSKGQDWIRKWDYGHEWLWTGNPDKDTKLSLIKETLQYSPLCVSVVAWHKDDKGHYYSPKGQPNNHWCVLYNVSQDGYEIFDSYEQSLKTLTFDHDIHFCKRYHLMPQNAPVEAYTPIFKGIWQTLLSILKYFNDKALGFTKKALGDID